MKAISVVIPAHNAAVTIRDTLLSLRSESDLLHEVIIVDDGSTDATGSIARKIGEACSLPINVIRAEYRDAGIARNLGIEASSAPWLYFLDADDRHVAGGLRGLLQRSKEVPGAGLIIGAYIRRTDGVTRRIKLPGSYWRDRMKNCEAYLDGRLRSIAVGCALVDRAAVGGERFPARVPYDEDTLFWAKVLLNAEVATIRSVILVYDVSSFRADGRFTIDPVQRFLQWQRALRDLQRFDIPKEPLRLREGIVALKIARVHYARGDLETSVRFLALAGAAPKYLRDSWRWVRYRLKVAIARELNLAKRTLALTGVIKAQS